MNPLKRIHYNAPVTLTFAIISAAVLFLSSFTGGTSDRLLFMVYRAPLTDPLMYIRLFTHVLGHGSPSHYLNNIIIILLIGPMIEEKYGHKNLAIMMVITAFATGLVWIMIYPEAKLGASGIVFMMILLSSFTNIQKGKIPLTLILAAPIYLGQEIMSAATQDTNVAYMSHIVGGVCGVLFGFYYNNFSKPERSRRTFL